MSTTTWVSVISRGFMTVMPSSVMWTTEMLSATKAVNTDMQKKKSSILKKPELHQEQANLLHSLLFLPENKLQLKHLTHVQSVE